MRREEILAVHGRCALRHVESAFLKHRVKLISTVRVNLQLGKRSIAEASCIHPNWTVCGKQSDEVRLCLHAGLLSLIVTKQVVLKVSELLRRNEAVPRENSGYVDTLCDVCTHGATNRRRSFKLVLERL